MIEQVNNVRIWEPDKYSENIIITEYHNVKNVKTDKQNRIFIICEGNTEEVFAKNIGSSAIPFNAM